MHTMFDRRRFVLGSSAAVAASGLAAQGSHAAQSSLANTQATAEDMPVRFALNTSTIRGQKLPIDQQIEVAAKVGYDGIEPWLGDINRYVEEGGKLVDLRKQIEDSGLFVASAIGFANWISEDKKQRQEGLEVARKDMETIAALGGELIAAPPVGAHRQGSPKPELPAIADRYRKLCELGKSIGVKPQLELWGFSPTLSQLGELAYVATAAQHEYACVLPDFYHIYKGGSDFAGLGMIEASRMHCFHMNDYPAEPERSKIADRDRVFPGDGVCELPTIIAMLIGNGFKGTFSLELFNPEYWKRDAVDVAREGLKKSRDVVKAALAVA